MEQVTRTRSRRTKSERGSTEKWTETLRLTQVEKRTVKRKGERRSGRLSKRGLENTYVKMQRHRIVAGTGRSPFRYGSGTEVVIGHQ